MKLPDMTVHLSQKLLIVLFIITIVLAETPAYAAPWSQVDNADAYTVGDCSRVERQALRGEIESIAQQVLTDESSRLDIAAVVHRQWSEHNVDGVIDAAVAQATEKLGNEEGYLNRLWSGWSAETAQEFATRIANDAFSAPTFKTAIDELARAIAAEIAREIEADFARAASAALLCLKAYIGQQYSTTLYQAFEGKVSVEVSSVPITATTPITVSPLGMHQTALGGLGVILATEISRRLAQKLSTKIAERMAGKIVQRILGRIGSGFIPVVGWVLGIAMIVWDLWEGVDGALPQIQEALSSEEIKSKIRGEITDAIDKGLPEETAVVALEMAVRMIEEWEGFCVTRPDVCTVAATNGTFQQILNDTPIDQLDKLTNLVDSFVQYVGQAELESAIGNGRFEKLLMLPESAYVILRTTKSSDALLAWATLAGDQLGKVAELGIYRSKTPEDFDAELLRALVATANQAAVDKLLNFNRVELTTLVDFAGENLAQITAKTSLDDLRALVAYLQQPGTGQAPPPSLPDDIVDGRRTVRDFLTPKPAITGAASDDLAATPTVAQRPSSTVSPPGGEITRYWSDNPRWVIAIGIGLLVLLGIAFVLVARRQASEPPVPTPVVAPPPEEPVEPPPRAAATIFPPRRTGAASVQTEPPRNTSPKTGKSSTRPPFLQPRSGSSKNRKP